MKNTLWLGAVLALLAAGCGGKTEEKKPAGTNTNQAAVGQNPIMAPVDYLSTITKAQQQATKTIDTVAVNQAIQLFNVQEGRMPKDLKELVDMKYLRGLPEAPYGMEIVYDAKTGTAKVVKKAP